MAFLLFEFILPYPGLTPWANSCRASGAELTQLHRHRLWDTKYQVPSTKYQTPSTKYQAPSTKHQVPNAKILSANCYLLIAHSSKLQPHFSGGAYFFKKFATRV